MQMKPILIYDSDVLPNNGLEGFHKIICWQYLSKTSRYKSFEILGFLEDNKFLIRKLYLEFLEKVSEHNVNGVLLKDLLLVENKFPCWEMSLLNEKSNIKSKNISNVLRVIALELWLQDNPCDAIYLFSNSQELSDAISSICKIKSLIFHHEKLLNIKRDKSFFIKYKLLASIKSNPIFWFIYFCIKRFPILFLKKPKEINLNNEILLISYLFNLDKSLANKPYGLDSFWTPLCKKIIEKDMKLNYLSIFSKSNYPQNFTQAIKIIKNFKNRNYANTQFNLVDNFLSIKIILKTINYFYKTRMISNQLYPSKILVLSSGVDVSSLFLKDWIDSFKGRVLIQNSLFFALFEDISCRIKNPSKIIYLQENQNWEYALIACFRKILPNLQIYGCCHSSLRFWDLRYYLCNQRNDNNQFLPNKNITNGPQATKLLIESGIKEENIIELEALRYLHTNKSKIGKKNNNNIGENKIKVLILGDYEDEKNKQIFEIVNQLENNIKTNLEISYKSHPVNINNLRHYSDIEIINSNEKISNLLSSFDLAICGPSTTASLECYLFGICLAVLLEKDSPIMTPTYQLPGTNFFSNSKALEDIIISKRFYKEEIANAEEIFKLDNDLTKWMEFIED